MSQKDYSTYVRELVKIKREVDAFLAKQGPCPPEFEKNWPTGWNLEWRSIDPITFVREVFPFFESEAIESCEGVPLSFFDSTKVMGASDKEWPDLVSSDEMARCLAATSAQVECFIQTGTWKSWLPDWGHIGAAPTCCELLPFGLAVVVEGKNRVAVYAKHGKLIGYNVFARLNYPRPSRLKLKENDAGFELVLDGEVSHQIKYCANILIPLFKCYGVMEVAKRELGEIESSPPLLVKRAGWMASISHRLKIGL